MALLRSLKASPRKIRKYRTRRDVKPNAQNLLILQYPSGPIGDAGVSYSLNLLDSVADAAIQKTIVGKSRPASLVKLNFVPPAAFFLMKI